MSIEEKSEDLLNANNNNNNNSNKKCPTRLRSKFSVAFNYRNKLDEQNNGIE